MLVTVDHCLKMPDAENHLRHSLRWGRTWGDAARGNRRSICRRGFSPRVVFHPTYYISRIQFIPAEGAFRIPIILLEESQCLISHDNDSCVFDCRKRQLILKHVDDTKGWPSPFCISWLVHRCMLFLKVEVPLTSPACPFMHGYNEFPVLIENSPSRL